MPTYSPCEKVAVIGLGYVGLPTALLLADAGLHVLGVDINPELVAALQAGQFPVEEPGLAALLHRVLESGRLRVTRRLESRDAYVITVPTPLDRETGGADLSAVRSAAEAVAEVARPGQLVILESTVPPGTLNRLVRPIIERQVPGLDYAFSPERVLPGRILAELPSNPRLIGADTDRAAQRARDLYATFVRGEIRVTDAVTAEMVKLMENTFRDVNIALANEFAMAAQALGVDVWEAIELANLHPRVHIHRPGPGVGGHCIPVDPWFLVERAPMVTALIRQARTTNDRMPVVVAETVERLTVRRGVAMPKVGLLGLAYKGDVDDSRESPAYVLARILQGRGFDVAAYDPLVRRGALPNATLEEAARGAHCLVLVTDHQRFRSIDPRQLRPLVAQPVVLDTRHHLDHRRWREAGFEVHVLGDGRHAALDAGDGGPGGSHPAATAEVQVDR